MKKWFILSTVTIVLLLVFGFQNCTKLPLVKQEMESIYEAPLLNLKSEICGFAQSLGSSSSKFIFVIDMSISNTGDFETRSGGYAYFNTALATDGEPASNIKTLDPDTQSNRFTAIQKFLDTCGSNSKSSFKVIGFSKTAGVISAGTMNGKSVSMLRCDLPQYRVFESAAATKISVQNLFARQQIEREKFEVYKNRAWDGALDLDQILLGPTSYPSAMSCVQDVILDDLKNVGTDSYHVFFLTDGKPAEDKNGICNSATDKNQCYLSKSLESLTMMKTASLMKGRNLTLHGVYYNALEPNVPTILTQISQEGGASEVLKFNGFKDPKSGLCQLTQTSSSLDWRPDNFGIINLTMQRGSGIFKVDSDMDGIADDDEDQFSSDPTNPRSLGIPILDGICKSLGGSSICKDKYAAIQFSCDATKYPNEYPINECEIKLLGLDTVALRNGSDPGLDSDLDGIPDFVEIIKGLNPAISDTGQDPDGDGIKNIDELISGRDLFSPDSQINSLQLNNTSVVFSPENTVDCPYGSWNLSLTRAQVAKTLYFNNLDLKFSKLNHSENEHVLLIYYRQATMNSTTANIQYMAKFVKMGYTRLSGVESLTTNISMIRKVDFQLMGKVTH